jgi:hypothetical protein
MFSLRITLCAICSLLVLATVAYATEDIQGYRLPGSTWILGKHPEKASLKGFKEIESPNDDVEAFLDLSRDIQFSGNEVEATVGLILSNDRVAMIVIEVDQEEKSFKSLKKYFRERRGDNDPVFSTSDSVLWEDDDDDYLGVFKYWNADGDQSNLIIYGRDDLMSHPEQDEVPDWMRNLLDG